MGTYDWHQVSKKTRTIARIYSKSVGKEVSFGAADFIRRIGRPDLVETKQLTREEFSDFKNGIGPYAPDYSMEVEECYGKGYI